MINPVANTIETFRNALSGIVFESKAVNVYTVPPDGELGNHIIIREPTTVEQGCKSIIGHDATIQIDVITPFAGNFGSPLPMETITSFVLQAIKPGTGNVLTVVDFDMITLMLTNSITDRNFFPTNRGLRKILTWSFIIDEGVVIPWILDTGFWNDSGIWKDTSVWID